MEQSDSRFSLYDLHGLSTRREFFHHVPLAIKDPSARKTLSYDSRGLKQFFPWFLSEFNSASHKGVIENFLRMVPVLRTMLEKSQYPFIRLDVNIYMTYIKVAQFHRE